MTIEERKQIEKWLIEEVEATFEEVQRILDELPKSMNPDEIESWCIDLEGQVGKLVRIILRKPMDEGFIRRWFLTV